MSAEKAIIEELVRQSRTISALASVIADQAILLENRLDRCSSVGCKSPATVEHVSTGLKKCDTCAAKCITGNGQMFGDETFKDEASWVDVPLATEVRRTAEYVQILKSLEVQPEMVQ